MAKLKSASFIKSRRQCVKRRKWRKSTQIAGKTIRIDTIMLLDQIQSEVALAQKNRDQLRVDTLRFLLGAVFNLQIEKGKNYVLTDVDVLSVIAKQVKTHNESIEMFTKGNRVDLVDREKAELVILQAYLPAQMSDGAKVAEIIKNG